MPGFTISEFAGKLSTFGLASPNKFKVEFKGMPVGNTTDRGIYWEEEGIQFAFAEVA